MVRISTQLHARFQPASAALFSNAQCDPQVFVP